MVEVLAGLLIGLTCCSSSLCKSWSVLASGFDVLPVPLKALGTACFLLMTYQPTELITICLKASQCRFLAPMFDSYEGVHLLLLAHF